jgi:hypothetical protein
MSVTTWFIEKPIQRSTDVILYWNKKNANTRKTNYLYLNRELEWHERYRAPKGGHPVASGRSKLSTVLNVLGTILSTYKVPSR